MKASKWSKTVRNARIVGGGLVNPQKTLAKKVTKKNYETSVFDIFLLCGPVAEYTFIQVCQCQCQCQCVRVLRTSPVCTGGGDSQLASQDRQ